MTNTVGAEHESSPKQWLLPYPSPPLSLQAGVNPGASRCKTHSHSSIKERKKSQNQAVMQSNSNWSGKQTEKILFSTPTLCWRICLPLWWCNCYIFQPTHMWLMNLPTLLEDVRDKVPWLLVRLQLFHRRMQRRLLTLPGLQHQATPFGTGQIVFWKKLASPQTSERPKMSTHLIFTWWVRWEESQPICLNTLVLPSWHPSQLLVAPLQLLYPEYYWMCPFTARGRFAVSNKKEGVLLCDPALPPSHAPSSLVHWHFVPFLPSFSNSISVG